MCPEPRSRERGRLVAETADDEVVVMVLDEVIYLMETAGEIPVRASVESP
ncbi:MAG: hypothetical protein ACRDPK_10375 [Carbonactinosporaceae bacterium]